MSEPCQYCAGQGRTTIMMRTPTGMQQATTIRCAHCSGTGVIAVPADPARTITRLLDAMGQKVFR